MLDAEDMAVRRMTNGIIDVILKDMCERSMCDYFPQRDEDRVSLDMLL